MVKVMIDPAFADWFRRIQQTEHILDLDTPAELVGLLDRPDISPDVPFGRIIQGRSWAIIPLDLLNVIDGDISSVPFDAESGYVFRKDGWTKFP